MLIVQLCTTVSASSSFLYQIIFGGNDKSVQDTLTKKDVSKLILEQMTQQ